MRRNWIHAFGIFFLTASILIAVPRWNEKMQDLSKTMGKVMSLLVVRQLTPSQTRELGRDIKKISETAHTIKIGTENKSKPLPPDADPSLAFISDLFERQSKRAYAAFQSGSIEYARSLMRGTTSYCIACHTRSDSGPDFPTFKLPQQASSLSLSEKADLLAATRQFKAALEEYTKAIADKKFAASRPIEWQRSVRQAINVAVRVKRAPEQALEITTLAMSGPQAAVPGYFAQQLDAWKKSLEEWKSQAEHKAITQEGLLNEATRLLAEAQSKQKYPADHSADIVYLRATSRAHDLLASSPDDESKAKALLIVGMGYEVLNDPMTWPIHEMYFEACIRVRPHSSIAQQCFDRYEESVYFGYSGSGGFSLPPEVVKTMDELRSLAKEVKKDG